jgi:phage baseplate assembly protein gpV
MSAEVIVTQSGDTSVIQEQVVTTVVTDDKPPRIITSGMMPPPAVNSLTNSADVDVSQLKDGGVLVYNTATNLWTATNLFEKQIFEAGQY